MSVPWGIKMNNAVNFPGEDKKVAAKRLWDLTDECISKINSPVKDDAWAKEIAEKILNIVVVNPSVSLSGNRCYALSHISDRTGLVLDNVSGAHAGMNYSIKVGPNMNSTCLSCLQPGDVSKNVRFAFMSSCGRMGKFISKYESIPEDFMKNSINVLARKRELPQLSVALQNGLKEWAASREDENKPRPSGIGNAIMGAIKRRLYPSHKAMCD